MKGFFRHTLAVVLSTAAGLAHGQAFTTRPLLVPVTYPTSLQFGPDDRLYVSEHYGVIHAFTVVRSAEGEYQSVAHETITAIRDIENHNDNGGACSDDCERRQVTGILVLGSAENPVLYVTSSDPRQAVANDSGLDTNSGLLTRLTCTGGVVSNQCQAWQRVDLVRGLPRSEENHAVNGLAFHAASRTIYLAVGGNTNKGAPSNSFSGTSEYFLAGAVLSIDLDALEAIEASNGGPYTDPRSGAKFVYDLLTLDDPTRANITKSSPQFPYPAGHPWRELSVDPGDPFGGNDGYNQALPVPGGPVQLHSMGYRNPYDVVVMQSGEIYTWDNGPNSGWGGTPWLRTSAGALKGYSTQPGVTFNPGAGDYCTNELNESGSGTLGDSLHRITAPGYYAGHPAPIRAFPTRSGIYNYVQQPDGHWLHEGVVHQLQNLLPAGYGVSAADFPDDARQCEYTVPAGGLETVSASTNGLAEYTAGNFAGAMQGDLLAASFNGNLYRCKPNGTGGLIDLPGSSSGTEIGKCEVLLGGFGAQPLDVTAQASDAIFPGTIWAATYGASSVTVFEPADFACDPSVPTEDSDDDGFSNGDEADNGTNACSAGSRPEDADGDLVSDLNDGDDDNDSLADINDVFALDPDNGLSTTLPLNLPLNNNDPGTGLFGLGFTGLMLARDGSSTWRDGYDAEHLAAGGTAGLLTVETVTAGTAAGNVNTQDNAFLVGIDADNTTPPFMAVTRLRPPWFEVGGAASTPQPGQSYGLFVGTGDQDDYVSVVLTAGTGGSGAMKVTVEIDGTATATTYSSSSWGDANLLAASALELGIVVDAQANTMLPRLSLDNGATWHALGSARAVPAAWFSAADAQGLAIGAISSSAGAVEFGATWDYFRADFVAGTSPGAWSRIDDSPETRHEGGFVQVGNKFHLIGGRESSNVRSWDLATGNWSTGAASPIKLHHFQAVALDGLIYAIGAMTGECCSEPPAPNVYIYDPLADRWITGPAMPAARARGGGGAVAVDGKIYQVSGNTSGHSGPVSAFVDVFDPATGRFTALNPIPNPRDHFFVAHHEGKIYVAGGRNSNAAADGDVFDDNVVAVDVYDIATNTWSTLPAGANLPTPRAAAPTGIIGNELIVAGGESGAQTAAHAQTEALDLDTHQWRTLAPMRTPRHATQAIVSNFGLYVAAGSSQRGGPSGAALDLEALHLFGSTPPLSESIGTGVLQATAQLDFGRIAVGAARQHTATLTLASGTQSVVVSDLALTGGAGFRLVSPPTLPFVVAPGRPVSLQVEFAPQAQGAVQASLTMSSPGRSPQVTQLLGEGFGKADAQVLYRVNLGGPQVAAIDAPAPAWSADTAVSPSPYRVAGGAEIFDDAQSGAYGGAVQMDDPSLPADVPAAVFQSERWDPAGAPEMQWSFPVEDGALVEVRLFFAELYSGIETTGERVLDARIEGQIPAEFDDIDRYAQAGAKGAMMRAALIEVDGTSLDLELLHVAENPALNAIEIRLVEPGVNLPPTARDDYASVAQSGNIAIPVLANDSDTDGSLVASTLQVIDAPDYGSVQPGAGNTIVYTHNGASALLDSFTYTVRDDDGAVSNAATVRVRRNIAALPADADGDGTVNASDSDDDNDGLADTRDAFAVDATNGLATALPHRLSLQPGNGGLFGLGFTGLMTNGISVAGSDYATLFDPARVFIDDAPDAAPRLTIAAIDDGTAAAGSNTQKHAFQFGVAADTASPMFVLRGQLHAPFFDGTPSPGQSQGIYLGTGDQDNFIELSLDGDLALKLRREVGGVPTTQSIAIPGGIDGVQQLALMLIVNPAAGEARAMLAIDGAPPIALGSAVNLPAAWLAPGDARGLAVGIIATSAGAPPAFAAHWQALEIVPLATDDIFAHTNGTGSSMIDVQANDAAAAGRRISALGTPDRGGAVSIDQNGTPANLLDDRVKYTPAAGANGVETFTYTVSTSFAWSDAGVVAVDLGLPGKIFGNGFESAQ